MMLIYILNFLDLTVYIMFQFDYDDVELLTLFFVLLSKLIKRKFY